MSPHAIAAGRRDTILHKTKLRGWGDNKGN